MREPSTTHPCCLCDDPCDCGYGFVGCIGCSECAMEDSEGLDPEDEDYE